MSVSASLDTSAVTVEPGATVEVTLQVANPGNTVESYRFEMVGACAGWSVVEPESVSLLPGTSGTTTVRLSPPRSPEVPAGDHSLGVRVVPSDHPDETVVPEAVVTVLPFTEITAELIPRTTSGRRRGRHRVAVDNRGNTPVPVGLAPAASSDRVRLTVTPAALTIPLGQAEIVPLTVRARSLRWRGAPVVNPFQVVATPELGTPVTLDGSFEQEVLLPRWLPRAAIAALLLVGALAGLWYGLLRPAVRSTARDAADAAVADPAGNGGGQNPPQNNPGGNPPGGGSVPAPGASDGGAPGGGGNPGGSGSPGGAPGGGGSASTPTPGAPGAPGAVAPPAAGTPVNVRLEAHDTVGGGPGVSNPDYRVPAGQTFDLTDLVVQNPQGDAGTVEISSQGRTLLRLALENFRDNDYHFISPIVVPSGGRVTMTVTCRQVGRPVGAPAPTQCVESLFLGGSLHRNP